MLRLGIIGTGAISHEFITAALESGSYDFVAVYSRNLKTAENFASAYSGLQLYTDMEAFLGSDLDVIYIASPNSLHYQQAKAALVAGKHVIVEKPAVTRPEEWQDLLATAFQHQVYIFEAARNVHEGAFALISDFLADKTILGAHFTYAKYSSKMGDLLAGKTPNVFSAQFAGGALMDLGVYTVYAAHRLFGAPETASYTAQQLPNSLDLNGAGTLFYPDFQVRVEAGKNIHSNLPAEIYTADGTLTLDSIEYIQSAVFYGHDGKELRLPTQPEKRKMTGQVATFAEIIQQKNQRAYQELADMATNVHQTLWNMRQSAGIAFEGENNEN